MLQRIRHAADIDPEAEASRPLPEGRAPARCRQPRPDQLVDRIAEPDVAFFPKPLHSSGYIIVQGQGSTHPSIVTHHDV